MRDIIDNMFFWKAQGTFIKDFNKECIETKNFIDSVLQFEFKFNIQQEKCYNREILNNLALKHNYIINDISTQKKFKLKNWIYKK